MASSKAPVALVTSESHALTRGAAHSGDPGDEWVSEQLKEGNLFFWSYPRCR